MCGEGGVPFDARLGGTDAATTPDPPASTCACRTGASGDRHLDLVALAMVAIAAIRRRR
jgi:MYXO-CTERM domain-containing protein